MSRQTLYFGTKFEDGQTVGMSLTCYWTDIEFFESFISTVNVAMAMCVRSCLSMSMANISIGKFILQENYCYRLNSHKRKLTNHITGMAYFHQEKPTAYDVHEMLNHVETYVENSNCISEKTGCYHKVRSTANQSTHSKGCYSFTATSFWSVSLTSIAAWRVWHSNTQLIASGITKIASLAPSTKIWTEIV